jgi:hypothetical protein
MAADSRQSWRPTSTSRWEVRSDKTQKIFEISRGASAIAYCIRGDTVNEDRSWDIAAELQSSIASVSAKRSLNSFVRAVCSGLQDRIESAKKRGQLKGYPITELCFIGYFRDDPCWADVQFDFHKDSDGLLYYLLARDCRPGCADLRGAVVLNRMIEDDDPRAGHLLDLNKNQDMPLDEAVSLARGYIEMCCSPLIRGLEDDGCGAIGGPPQVATVSPRDRSRSTIQRWLGCFGTRAAFQWKTAYPS